MRSQEKAILAAVAEGAFNVATPFLSKAELMDIAAKTSEYLGGDPKRLTRNNLESWYRLGILAEPKRTDRNRLFSVLDVFHAGAVFHLSSHGISLAACKETVPILEHWLTENFERSADPLDYDHVSELRVQDLIVLSSMSGGWQITWFDTPEQLSLQTKLSAVVLLFNAASFFAFTVSVSRQKWEEKALSLRRKLEARATALRQKMDRQSAHDRGDE